METMGVKKSMDTSIHLNDLEQELLTWGVDHLQTCTFFYCKSSSLLSDP